MNFILNILGTIFNKLVGRQKTETSKNVTINRTENTSAVADARALILWICGISLAFYWLPLYGFATYFWIKSCLAKNILLPYPISADKLFEMIGSLLGLGTVGFLHKLFKRNK